MITFQHIREAIALPAHFDSLDAQMQMAPVGRARMQPNPDKPPRQSAVLLLIYPKLGERLHLILTKRTSHLRGHSGQVSFPGGRRDPEDPTYEATALRETCEELGICGEHIEIIGRLNKLWIPPSNFDVYPVVGLMQREPQITPSPDEVEKVLHMPLPALIDDMTKQVTQMNFRGQAIDVPYYDVQGHIVWGATCMMLSEFEQRLLTVLS